MLKPCILTVCGAALIGLSSLPLNAAEPSAAIGWQQGYQTFVSNKLGVDAGQARFAYQQLIEQLKHQIATCQSCAMPWLLLGMIYREQAHLNGGLSSLKKAKAAQLAMLRAVRLDQDAADGLGLVQLGLLYLDTPGWPLSFGDESKGLMLLHKAWQHFPKSVAANLALGRYYFAKRDFDKSRTYLETAITNADPEQDDPMQKAEIRQARDMLQKIKK